MGSSKGFGLAALMVLSLFTFSAPAQTWGEIFNQKKTQQKYLMQQIAALQLYIGYAKKGYAIVGGGINLVRDISDGQFGLHKSFFASLAAVNPNIKSSAVVSEIIESGLSIVSIAKSWKPSEFSLSEGAYVSMVKANLLTLVVSDLEELLLVITSGRLEMKDDERMDRLQALRESLQEKHGFSLSFDSDLRMLKRQRGREQQSIDQIRRWYGIE